MKHILFQIEQEKADLAVPGTKCHHKQIKVVHCSPAVDWKPLYWWTRHPQESGLENVANYDWYLIMLTFVSLFVVMVCLKLLTYVGQEFGLASSLQEISFFPFP